MTDSPDGTPRVGEEITAKNTRLGMPPVPAATSRDRGAGPFRRLVLRGATLIDGTGAPLGGRSTSWWRRTGSPPSSASARRTSP